MIVLHHVAASRSFRTLWLLEELGLTCEVKPYSLRDGGLRSPDFLAMSPAGRVPALEIDGKVIFESVAIAQYLCETRPLEGLAPKPDDEDRVAFLQWLSFAETQASIIAGLNLQMIFLMPPAKPSVPVLKLEVARLKATLRALEAALADQPWVLNSGFSAADTMFGYNLFAAAYFVNLGKYPHIQAYMKRMEDRPAYQRAREQDGVQEFYDRSHYAPEDYA